MRNKRLAKGAGVLFLDLNDDDRLRRNGLQLLGSFLTDGLEWRAILGAVLLVVRNIDDLLFARQMLWERLLLAATFLARIGDRLSLDRRLRYDFTEKLDHVIRVGCFAHVRRKFFEAQKASKDKKSISGRALKLIKKLYRIDEAIAKLPDAMRTLERKTQATPVLEEFKAFCEENQRLLPPQSATGKAISYALNSWAQPLPIYDDYRIRLDNNLTENAIRPVAVGRKNYLFCQSPEGAQAAARIYSVLATEKANGLNLRAYFIRLIDGLPRAKTIENIEALLPFVHSQ